MSPADGSTFPLTATERVISRIPPHFSALERVCFLMVADDTPEAVRRVAKREVTRAHAARREHEGSRGVAWSAMANDPYSVRSLDEIQAEAREDEARLASPRGRFVAALNALDELGYVREAHSARAAYYRGFADDRYPGSIGEITNAIIAVNDLAGNAARDARLCLCELIHAAMLGKAA